VRKFRKGDWVKSVRRKSRKGSFVGQIIDTIDGDYIVRDAQNLKWLRTETELSAATAKKEAA
jgi:hypothetical protein